MRVSYNCSLVLVLLFLVCLFDSDLRGAFRPSDTAINNILAVRYHRYGGSVGPASEHKNVILTGRKLLMKPGLSQEEVSNSNGGYIDNHSLKKISHGGTRKRSMKHLKEKGHTRDEGGSVGAFTEDYRVPRPHPPRNN